MASVLRISYLGKDTSQISTVFDHAEAWKLADHAAMLVPRVAAEALTEVDM